MEVLPRRLAEKLGSAIRMDFPVHAIHRREDGGWMVGNEVYSDVVLALPAHAMSKLATPFKLSLLDEIYYPPVTSLSLGFGSNQFTHPLNGFGMLIPQVEKRYSLGALFPSSIFPGRAPAGMVLLTVFIGGSQWPDRAMHDEEQMLSHVLGDLRDLLGLEGGPDYRRFSVWPQAIPQYVIGYEKYLNHMRQIERDHPGIHFAGHYRDGISVANSILSGIKIAERIYDESAT